jgi:hypothetical protein
MKIKVYLVTENTKNGSYIHAYPFSVDGLIEAQEKFREIAKTFNDGNSAGYFSEKEIEVGILHGMLSHDYDEYRCITLTESEGDFL